MMKSVWTAVFSVGVSSCFVMADEPSKWTPSNAEKVVGLYDEFMESSDWQMAELIALGAKEKFGDEEPAIQRMLKKVRQAKADAQKPAANMKTTNPNPHLTYIKTYSVEKLGCYSINNGDLVISKDIIKKLEKVIGDEEMEKTDSSIAPFNTNLSLVICTTQHYHDRIAECLKQMHAEQAADLEKLEAK